MIMARSKRQHLGSKQEVPQVTQTPGRFMRLVNKLKPIMSIIGSAFAFTVGVDTIATLGYRRQGEFVALLEETIASIPKEEAGSFTAELKAVLNALQDAMVKKNFGITQLVIDIFLVIANMFTTLFNVLAGIVSGKVLDVYDTIANADWTEFAENFTKLRMSASLSLAAIVAASWIGFKLLSAIKSRFWKSSSSSFKQDKDVVYSKSLSREMESVPYDGEYTDDYDDTYTNRSFTEDDDASALYDGEYTDDYENTYTDRSFTEDAHTFSNNSRNASRRGRRSQPHHGSHTSFYHPSTNAHAISSNRKRRTFRYGTPRSPLHGLR